MAARAMVLRAPRPRPRKAAVRRLLLAARRSWPSCASLALEPRPGRRTARSTPRPGRPCPRWSPSPWPAPGQPRGRRRGRRGLRGLRAGGRGDERVAPGIAALRAQRGGGLGRPVPLPGDLCQVLRAGRDGAERTGGLFDPTWAALRGVWRFGDGEPPRVPSDAEVAAACPLVSWRDLEIEPPGDPASDAPCTARLRRAGMQVGLGGLAKGWARRPGRRRAAAAGAARLHRPGRGRPLRRRERATAAPGAWGCATRAARRASPSPGWRSPTPPSPRAATRSASSSRRGSATTTSSTPAPADRRRRAARRACSRRAPSRPRSWARRSSSWAARRGSRWPRAAAPRR